MRRWTRTIWLIAALAAIAAASCTFGRILKYGPSNVDDFRIFPTRPLRASAAPFRFLPNDGRGAPERATLPDGTEEHLDHLLADNDTLAFLLIQDDVLAAERYYNGHGAKALSLAFSMTKSFTSILIGAALADGRLRSLDQPVTDYVPELKPAGFEAVTLRHLLQMTSGMDYVESDNPFGMHPHYYYGEDLEERLLRLTLAKPPGQEFRYKSGEAQLLGLVLKRALAPQTITAYMQERLWEPLGMEHDAAWCVDREPDGIEKTFCCLALTARDAAKFGRLYLNNGEWNGKQLIPRDYVEESTRIDTADGGAWDYQFQWWLQSPDGSDFLAIGHLGQYLYVNRPKRLIVVRMGASRGCLSGDEWRALLVDIARRMPPAAGINFNAIQPAN
ncbi:MAG: class C beta-lactamase-related serine hydrolase [Myxococcales bacterium]|nr:MAG: class C beta-lactamase-related serine hydrolase [Myxococcales bacterium]